MNVFKRFFIPKSSYPASMWIDEHKFVTLNILLSSTLLSLIIFLVLRFYQGNMQMVIVNASGITLFGISIIFLRVNKNNYDLISRLFILGAFILVSINMNFAQHGSRAIWYASIIIAGFYFRDKKEGLLWMGFFIITTIIIGSINVEAFTTLRYIDFLTLIVNFLLMSLLLSRYEMLKDRERSHLIYQTKVLEQITITDNLTGMYNRRYLYQIVDTILQRLRRDQKSFIFVMIDIDDFKPYNDCYGHFAGDEVLKKVADVIMKNSERANDYAFRIGGEEFCIIMEGLSPKESFDHIEKIRQEICDLQIKHEKNAKDKIVTASFGIEYLIPDGETNIDTIFKNADAKLYDAKAKGRNQTVM